MSSFSYQMRVATRQPHAISDMLANSKLALALSDESVWIDALTVFYEVFHYLEQLKNELNIPELNALFVDKALYRCEAFEKDLKRYYGNNWRYNIYTRPEVAEYLFHLSDIHKNKPIMLLAYVYHLYMGLLSGGQIIRMKRRVKNMTSTIFSFLTPWKNEIETIDWVVEFPNSNISELKKKLKQAVNDVAENLSEDDRSGLLEESKTVFMYNNKIIKSIKGTNKVAAYKVISIIVVIKIAVVAYLLFR